MFLQFVGSKTFFSQSQELAMVKIHGSPLRQIGPSPSPAPINLVNLNITFTTAINLFASTRLSALSKCITASQAGYCTGLG